MPIFHSSCCYGACKDRISNGPSHTGGTGHSDLDTYITFVTGHSLFDRMPFIADLKKKIEFVMAVR